MHVANDFIAQEARMHCSTRTCSILAAAAVLLAPAALSGCARNGAEAPTVSGPAAPGSIVLRAAGVLDGRGARLANRDVVVVDGVITGIVPNGEGNGETVYTFDDVTLLPGLIDTHVHIGWHFDRTGRTPSREVQETPEEAILYSAENAWATLVGGVTTAQSVGSASDVALRDAINRGILPGPRILTSIRQIGGGPDTDPDDLRARVAGLAEQGADVIKVFASASIRVGGTPTLTQEQLDAICGEAAAHGLRTVVHAHGPESAARTARAGCTTIEHGALLDRATLELLAEEGLFYDPNIDLIFRNYFENRDRFIGVGNYTEEGFEQMRQAVPSALAAFQEALTVSGLRIVFGTDAVAGAHGRNYQELVYRSQTGGQDPMDAVVSATSLAAESLGMADRIGSIGTGMAADIIGTVGDPSTDITALGRVAFVMKDGVVYKNDPVGR